MNPYSPPVAQAPYASYVQPVAAGTSVSEGAIEMLRLTRPWVMFMSVVFFLGAGLMLLGGLAVMAMSALASAASPGIPGWLGAVYIPLAAIYIYPGVKAWMYAGSIGRLLASRGVGDLESALLQQKSIWKYFGVTTIVCVVGYFVAIVVAVLAGVAGALGKH